MITSAALSHKKIVNFILKFVRDKEIILLANHFLMNKANHSPIILKIFFNLLCIGISLGQLDNAFSSPEFTQKVGMIDCKIEFSESAFLNLSFKLLVKTNRLKREKYYSKDEIMNQHLIELFKKILRSDSSPELEKCKEIIECQLDRFLSNINDYSESESNALFNLFEGGEYLKLRPGAYAKTMDGRNAIIVGFTSLWFDIQSKNILLLDEKKNPIIYKELSKSLEY
jgi:hypothetical protein